VFAATALGLLVFYGSATWQRGALFADSAAVFAEAASKAPASAGAHYQLGHALEERGDLNGAASAYRAALDCQPPNGDVQRRATNNLARAYVNLNRLPEAEAVLERGRTLWPDDPKVLRNLIKVVTRRGDEARARALFSELQQRFTGTPEPESD
jgi:Flp pilus assembly protein TadD